MKTPHGEEQGYVVLQNDPTVTAVSTETHAVPGVGAVYTPSVFSVPLSDGDSHGDSYDLDETRLSRARNTQVPDK